MRMRSWRPATVLSVVTLLLLAAPILAATASAESFQIVQAFSPTPQTPSGRLLEVADGLFYGVSRAGGEFSKGTVFVLYRRADRSWSTVTIHSFNGTDGASPWAGLIRGSDGYFYGTTLVGGARDYGTIFRMTWFGALTTLHSFSGADGALPRAPLLQARNGAFYGTTDSGGANSNPGTIFKFTSNGNFTVLHSFTGIDGYSPNGLFQAADGDFYGTTSIGGTPYHSGTAFKMTDAGVVTVLHDFRPDLDDGQHPSAIVQGADGDFYGTTSNSSNSVPGNRGTVFRMTRDGAVTLLHTFVAGSVDGAAPETGLVEAPDHSFYGTTTTTAYRITSAGDFATLSQFGGSLGMTPSELTPTRSGFLVGTTQLGGVPMTAGPTGGFGTAFSMTTSGPATLLYSFSGLSPVQPMGTLVEVSGALYGTSCRGGIYDRGTIFKLNAGAVTTLHSFTGLDDGTCPVSGLLPGPDGNLYGTAFFGGPSGQGGSVFKVTQDGELTVLHTFSAPPDAGMRPWGGLAWGADGNLYGTTSDIWFGFVGTVFRITTAGTLTTLYQFNPAVDGTLPLGSLVLATDGSFYGTTARRPDSSSGGTLFRLMPDGTFLSLHSFTQERAAPFAGLIQAHDGNLYGTARMGGTFGSGVLFKSTLSGTVSILHEFGSADGSAPYAPLLEAHDGVLYGTTSAGGGDADSGTVFKVASDGHVTTVHTFAGPDGATPVAGLFQASDGALYGTTTRGGPGKGGVVFRIVP
jgi:uncharacterized repeat protein (TIGR03803 family)